MRRLRHDLDHLTSAALLVAALSAILTGAVAHLWDLNDFWWHTYSGYVMAGLALVHVALNWKALVRYTRSRVRGWRRRAQAATQDRRVATPRPAVAPVPAQVRGALLSRRGLLGVAVGSFGGWLGGRGLRPPPVIEHGADVGLVYHEWSKPGVLDALGTLANLGEQPPRYKRVAGARYGALPAQRLDGGLPTEVAITGRRSQRTYVHEPLTLDELSRLLALTGGEDGDRRTAPSSGALYPVEIYPVVHRVEGLAAGLYHYGVEDHSLGLLREADLRGAIVRYGLMQDWLAECGAVLVLTVIFQRMRFKYGDRTYRYGLLEAGHLGQNLYLAATSMGLGACAVGAFLDDQLNTMLGVDGVEEAAVYILGVGRTGSG